MKGKEIPMKIYSCFFSVCLLLAASSANSDTILRDANRLLELTDLGSQFDYITKVQTQKIIRTYSSIVKMSNSVILPEEIKKQIRSCYANTYAWNRFSHGIAEILAKSFTHREITLLIEFYSNLGLSPKEISTFKSLIKKAEIIEEVSIQYIHENSESCVAWDSKLINHFLKNDNIPQQSSLVNHE